MNKKRKVVLFIAMSLDGYIADKNGDLDWLYAVEGEGDNGFSSFYKTIDTIVMGRTTYDHLLRLVPEYPHGDKNSYIFSHTEKRNDPYVTFVNEDPGTFMQALQLEEGANIWLVGGAGLLDSFLQKNLVDEIILTISPIILGEGTPLFRLNSHEIQLHLVSQKQYGQFVQIHYEVRSAIN